MNTSHTLSVPVALLIVSAEVPAPAAGPDDVLTVERAVELRRVTDAVISPTGHDVAYVVSVPRTAEDEPGPPWSEIWLASLDGGEPRRFTPAGMESSSPRWSPDGATIAFLSHRPEQHEESQIYVIPIDGGEASRVTAEPAGVSALRWAPGGERIAFLAPDHDPAETEEKEETGRDWVVVDREDPITRAWVVHVESGETHEVGTGALHLTALEWTPDGSTLLVAATKRPGADAELMERRLYRARAAGEDRDDRPADPELLFPTEGKLGGFLPSPDGKRLAFLGAAALNDPLPQTVFVAPIDGSRPRGIGPGAGASAQSVAWVDEGTLLELAGRGTATVLSRLDVATGERRPLETGKLVLSSVTLDAGSRRFCCVASSPDHPGELFAGSLDSVGLTRLTELNPHLADLRLAPTETITWESSDGLEIEGVLTYPVDFERGRRYPLVVNPHGGPEGVTTDGWDDLPQLLAARGYLVLQPNYRGSGGRGVGFSQGDHDDLGGLEFQDILTGVDALVASGLADGERVGMGGWSYGGYLSALAATHHSGRFRAAVMGAGISNWVSFTGTTDIPREMTIVHWNRPLRGNARLYWERSPLSGIGKARTPTLILSGADDERVPLTQGRELFHALHERGVPTEMVIYPRAGHGIREREHRIDLLTRQLDWFDRHLEPLSE